MEDEKVLELYDFRRVPVPDKLLEIKVSREELDRQVWDIAKRALTIGRAADGARAGDLVLVQLCSGNADEEQVQVNLGTGFWNPFLEETLPGMKIGEAKEIVGTEGTQTVTVTDIKRREFPEITDELVCAQGIPSVDTVAKYRDFVKDRIASGLKRRKMQAISGVVIREVIQKSRFGDLTQETERMYEDTRKNMRKTARAKGVSYKELLAGYFPEKIKSTEERERKLKEMCLQQIYEEFLGRGLAAQTGVSYSEADYEEEMRQLAESLQCTVAEMKAKRDYETYLSYAYKEYYAKELYRYFESKFQVEVI